MPPGPNDRRVAIGIATVAAELASAFIARQSPAPASADAS
jgi:hypothetical protein